MWPIFKSFLPNTYVHRYHVRISHSNIWLFKWCEISAFLNQVRLCILKTTTQVNVYCLLLMTAVHKGTEAKKVFSCQLRSFFSFFVFLFQFLLWSLTVCPSLSIVFLTDTRGAGRWLWLWTGGLWYSQQDQCPDWRWPAYCWTECSGKWMFASLLYIPVRSDWNRINMCIYLVEGGQKGQIHHIINCCFIASIVGWGASWTASQPITHPCSPAILESIHPTSSTYIAWKSI